MFDVDFDIEFFDKFVFHGCQPEFMSIEYLINAFTYNESLEFDNDKINIWYVRDDIGCNDFVYNKDGDVVKLDEINTETEINKLLDAINSMKDVDKKHWEGILNKKLESISPSVSSTEKKAENKAAQQAEKGKTEKEKTEKEKRMKEEINQADFTKLLEIYNKLKGEVEKKLNEIKPSNNSS